MSYITEHKQKFKELKVYLENKNQIKIKANGGNTILFSYPPDEDNLYIDKAKEIYKDKAVFIDISKLFVENIKNDGWDNFKELYKDYKNTPHKVFKSDDDPDTDLFDMIITKIEMAYKNDKIPFLIRTGALYGTGIENLNIMEHKSVMTNTYPLVVFYPSSLKDDNLYFLNFKLASKYRCILVK